MSFLTYKILLDPHTFESLLQEITVPEHDDEMPLGKRRMTSEEAESKWTEEEFIKELSRYGYGFAAKSYIKEHNLFKE